MICPKCGQRVTTVGRTCAYRDGREVKRYRYCTTCPHSWVTYEIECSRLKRPEPSTNRTASTNTNV